MTHPAASAHVIPFHPKLKASFPWSRVIVGLSMLAGILLALAGAALLTGFAQNASLAKGRGIDVLALAFLVGVGPYALATEIRRSRRNALDTRLPDFLTDLASLHKAGLTLQDSLQTTATGNYGRLTADVRMAAEQARWNIPVLTALGNLRDRMGTPIAARTLTVVLEAGHTGGNVPEVLEIAAGNARTFVALREQRKRSMGIYTIITYVASLVFIGVTLSLQGIFVPRMIEAFSGGANTALRLASALPTAEAFRAMFYTAALVQAVGNGIVGGIMGEGSAVAGLKHAWSMVLMCFLGFLVAV